MGIIKAPITGPASVVMPPRSTYIRKLKVMVTEATDGEMLPIKLA